MSDIISKDREYENGKKNDKKEWSMFTFMAGDNYLSQDSLMDVIEMEKAGSSPSTNVLAEMDADAGDFEGSIRWEITQ
jgi:hypothetical protein